MHVLKTTVASKVAVPGYHRWPEAHEHRKYLRDRHRHLFTVEATVEVTESRQTEFHDLQQQIREALNQGFPHSDGYEFGDSSCEEIATQVGFYLAIDLPVRSVRVSEDEESEATVYFCPGGHDVQNQ